MSTEQDQERPEQSSSPVQQQQQQQQQVPSVEGHGGQGSDSAMKHMRVWEQRRNADSGGRRRQGPQ